MTHAQTASSPLDPGFPMPPRAQRALAAPEVQLRVLAGPQAGASIEVKSGSEVSIGSAGAQHCQIVLRDPRVQGHRIRLRLQDGRARIKLVQGQVDLAGQVLTGPCAANWPFFAPLRLGDTVIALGPARSPEWQALGERLLPAAANEGPASVWPGDEPAAGAPAAAPGARRPRAEAWVAAAGATVAAVMAALLGLVSITSSARHSESPTSEHDRYVQVLNREAFRGLRLEADPTGRTVVRGELATRDARQQLERELARAGLVPALKVEVADDLASAVGDVFRMHGVAAQVQRSAQYPGVYEVRTAEVDEAKLRQAEAAARRDVPGAHQLQLHNSAPRVPPPATETPYDARKRVAAIVNGEVPYLVTADGTRYFVGAMLPSGHRVESITDQQVLLSKDGMSSPLRF